MNNLGLGSLSDIQVVGHFGNHLTALIWLTLTAALMYAGPATYSLIYLLIYDHPKAGKAGEEPKLTPLDIEEEKFEHHKAA
jgi:hypothetical protein